MNHYSAIKFTIKMSNLNTILLCLKHYKFNQNTSCMLIMNLPVVLYLICAKVYCVNFVSATTSAFFYLPDSVLCICCVSTAAKFTCLTFHTSVLPRSLTYLIYDSQSRFYQYMHVLIKIGRSLVKVCAHLFLL